MAYKDKDPCRDKAHPEEPIFTLRGQDKWAPTLVRIWARLAGSTGADPKKIEEATACAEEMERWAKERGKWPD